MHRQYTCPCFIRTLVLIVLTEPTIKTRDIFLDSLSFPGTILLLLLSLTRLKLPLFSQHLLPPLSLYTKGNWISLSTFMAISSTVISSRIMGFHSVILPTFSHKQVEGIYRHPWIFISVSVC